MFTIDLFSPSGDIADAGFSIREDRQGLIIQFLGYGSGPEEYRLRISYRGSEVDRLLTVP